MSKVRVTSHNGRVGKDGVYSNKHNDRRFNLEKAAHIDSTKTGENVYWFFETDEIGESDSIEEHELKFYNRHFKAYLNKKNANPIKNRQYSRVKTMEQFMASPTTCPEETIIQIGKCDDLKKADAETLTKIFEEFMEWHRQNYLQAVFLDAALHLDEPDCAAHIHARRVWIAHENGIEIASQSKALEEMGVERPFPDKPKGRYNNAKIVYTLDCRNKLIELGKKYGFDIEEEPKEASESGLAFEDYKRRQAEKKLEESRRQLALTNKIIEDLTEKVANKIVPERVGIIKKTGNMVMNKDTYDQVMEALDYLKTASANMEEIAKSTEEDRAAAAEARKKAELSAYQQEMAIQAAAQKLLEENYEEELKAKEAAKRYLAETEKLYKGSGMRLKKAAAYAVKNGNKAMTDYFSKRTLSDGRNALEAFTQDYSASIRQRANLTEDALAAELSNLSPGVEDEEDEGRKK